MSCNFLSNILPQVYSDRKLLKTVDIVRLAREALQQVCQLASVCIVNQPASTIQEELKQWWNEVGKDILLNAVEEDQDSEHEDESGDEEDAEDGEMPQVKVELKNLQDCVEIAKQGILI